MHVTLTAHHDAAHCTWCEKEKECVTTNFDDGFIRQSPLCWNCLTKAIRVRSRQAQSVPQPTRTGTTNIH